MVKWEDFFPNTDASIKNIFGNGEENDHFFNLGYEYYTEWCFRKIYKIFDIGGMPETWDKDYFLEGVFKWGLLGTTDTTMGILPLRAAVAGVNVFNRPTTLNFANPILGSFERTIDKDCTVLKINSNFMGAGKIVDRYARLLALCDSSIAVGLQNAKVAFIGFAEDKKQADDMKLMYSQISSGKPAVFVRKSSVSKESFEYNHVRENYVCDSIEELKRQIKNDFLTEIGIKAVPFEKKAQINNDETNSNDQELEISSKYWFDNLKDGIERTNKMFGLNLTISKVQGDSSIKEEAENGNSDITRLILNR